MKMPALIKNLQQRRARKRYERDKALRAQQDENAVNRVAENTKNYMGGGGMTGG